MHAITTILAAATITSAQSTQAQDTLFSSTGTPYEVEVESLSLTDVTTGGKDITTIHNSRPFNVIANLKWNQEIYNLDSSNSLEWILFVDGVYQSDGTVDLNKHRALPTTLEAGTAAVYNSRSHNIAVTIKVYEIKNETERDYESFAPGACSTMVMVFTATQHTWWSFHLVWASLSVPVVTFWSILVGTISSGWEAFANWVSILLGFGMMAFHVVFTAESPVNKSGRYDIFTALYLRLSKNANESLAKLKEDTMIVYETGEPVPLSSENNMELDFVAEKMELEFENFVAEKREGFDGGTDYRRL